MLLGRERFAKGLLKGSFRVPFEQPPNDLYEMERLEIEHKNQFEFHWEHLIAVPFHTRGSSQTPMLFIKWMVRA